MGVNSLPKTVTRQRRDCDLNPGPSAPESSTLTTRLPSHPSQWDCCLPIATLQTVLTSAGKASLRSLWASSAIACVSLAFCVACVSSRWTITFVSSATFYTHPTHPAHLSTPLHTPNHTSAHLSTHLILTFVSSATFYTHPTHLSTPGTAVTATEHLSPLFDTRCQSCFKRQQRTFKNKR